MTFRRGVLIGALLAAVAAVWQFAGPAAPASAQAGTDPEPRELLEAVVVAVHGAPGFTVERSYPGLLVPRRSGSWGFELPGRVVEVRVDVGARVTAGQILARQDSSEVTARRAVATADLSASQARLADAELGPRESVLAAARARVAADEFEFARLETQRRREQELLDESVGTQSRFDDVRFRESAQQAALEASRNDLQELVDGTRPEILKLRRAEVAAIEARILELDVALGKRQLEAAWDENVAARHHDEGAIVGPGQPVFEVVESGVLEAHIAVPWVAATALRPGAKRRLWLNEASVEAELIAVSPRVDRSTRSLELRFEFAPPSPGWVPGRVVRLSLERSVEEAGWWIPMAALTRARRGLWAALIAVPQDDGSHVIERRELEVLHTDGKRVFVRGALSDGDRVVAGGVLKFSIGQRVRPLLRKVEP